MNNIGLEKIDLEKLSEELRKYENTWVAISDDNKVVSSALTYKEAVGKAGRAQNIVLLKVPSLSASLAPFAYFI